MTNVMTRTLLLLGVLAAAGGCATQPADNAILSASDAQQMIEVTITPATDTLQARAEETGASDRFSP